MSLMSDATLLKVVNNTYVSLERRWYEEILVELGLYSLADLHSGEYGTKRDLIMQTLQGPHEQLILNALYERVRFDGDTLHALAMDGIEFGRSIAEGLADPDQEHSHLEDELTYRNHSKDTPVHREDSAVSNENKRKAELRGLQSALEKLEIERTKGMVDIGTYLRLTEEFETRKAKLEEDGSQ
jgi:hypothetical protein